MHQFDPVINRKVPIPRTSAFAGAGQRGGLELAGRPLLEFVLHPPRITVVTYPSTDIITVIQHHLTIVTITINPTVYVYVYICIYYLGDIYQEPLNIFRLNLHLNMCLKVFVPSKKG